MFRKLSPNPSLEHLKKQAKDRLHEMKQENPALQLADAQHALAREYGFASWPKLKAHVESLRAAESQSTDLTEKPNPFIGKWTAILSKSKRHPSNAFQRATIQFDVDGNSVTITDTVVDEAGLEIQTKNTLLIDGNEQPSHSGYILTTSWRGANVIESAATKDGEAVGWGRYEVSDDGKTLTITGDQQVIVLDRNDP